MVFKTQGKQARDLGGQSVLVLEADRGKDGINKSKTTSVLQWRRCLRSPGGPKSILIKQRPDVEG